MKKVTPKDTKATILEAYNEALETIKEFESQTMKPEKKVAEENNKRIVIGAKTKISDLIDFVDNAANTIGNAVSGFNEVNQAIEIKKQEIKNLFDIESEALSLAALIDSQEELKRKFHKETTERRLFAEKSLQDLRDQIKEEEEERAKEEKRKEEEFLYEFERKKKLEADKLNDQLEGSRKQHKENILSQYEEINTIKKNLDEREEKVNEAEEELNQMKATIEEMPNVIAAEVAAKVGREKGILMNKLEQEKKYFERDISAKAEMLEAQNLNLENEKAMLITQVSILTDKLENAYKEIKDISVKTVEGAGNSTMFNEMKTLLRENKTSGK